MSDKRLKPLSLAPLTLDEALKGAMDVPPPDEPKPTKKRLMKKKPATRVRKKKGR